MKPSKLTHKKPKVIASAKFWLILGIVFIMSGFLLAHMSNENLIHWSNGSETIAHLIFHIGGPIFFLSGMVKLLLEKFRR